jgi:hypothetical protein
VAVALLPLLSHANALFLAGLALLALHQVFVGHVEEGVDVLDGGGDWVEMAAPGLHWRFQEPDFVGLEELEHVAGHFGLHLMELPVLRRRVHLERLRMPIVVRLLARQSAHEPVRVRVHVVVLLLHAL